MGHWTQEIKRENAALKQALLAVLHEDKMAVASRLTKERDCPAGGEYSLGYLTCANEVTMRMNEAHGRVSDVLLEAGIIL